MQNMWSDDGFTIAENPLLVRLFFIIPYDKFRRSAAQCRDADVESQSPWCFGSRSLVIGTNSSGERPAAGHSGPLPDPARRAAGGPRGRGPPHPDACRHDSVVKIIGCSFFYWLIKLLKERLRLIDLATDSVFIGLHVSHGRGQVRLLGDLKTRH